MRRKTVETLVFSRLVPALAVGLYLAVGTTNLDLPGLQYDEAFDPLVAVDILDGRQPICARTVTIAGRQWPVMLGDYEGPTTIYTSLVGLSWLGVSVRSLRITQLSIGALTLALLGILGRRWFGQRVAAVAMLLCATAPAFVFWSRSGANWMLPQLPIALAMVLALDCFWRTGASRWAVVGATLFGIGVTSKILFVWLAAPIALTALVIWRGGSLPRPPWLIATLGLLCGLAPLLLHNLDGAPTWKRLRDNALTTQLYGHDNLAFAHNLNEQAGSFARMIGGSLSPMAAPEGWPIGGALLTLGLAIPAWTLWRRRNEVARDPARVGRFFLVATLLTVVPISTVSLTHLGATYLFVIVPFTWLLVAVALVDLASLLPRSRAPVAVLALSAVLVANHLASSRQIHRFFVATGGRGLWSDSSSALAARLEAEGRPVSAMDWGFSRNVAFLTSGRLRPEEHFEYLPAPSPRLAEICASLLDDPARLYLFHVERHTAFRGVLPVLEQAAARRGLVLELFASFTERDGAPNTLVYEARPVR